MKRWYRRRPIYFNTPLRIEDIARELGMSVSEFHARFRAVTAMSPWQFQKQLRLGEARRVKLSEDFHAGGAGYRVGDDDPSPVLPGAKREICGDPDRRVRRRGARA